MSADLIARLRMGGVAYVSESGPVYRGPTSLEREAASALEAAEARIASVRDESVEGWQPIETAPRDGTAIIGLCCHKADQYHDSNGRLTVYAAHAEGLGQVSDGLHVVVWGGEYDDTDDGYIPNWWFRSGSEWEEVANPTHWRPLPTPPAPKQEGA